MRSSSQAVLALFLIALVMTIGGGLTQRLRELLPDAKIIVVTMSEETSDKLPEDDADRADCIIHVDLPE